MVVFPNCKINIGLNITGKRPDGFHDLQTIFYPIAIKDALEIIENKTGDEAVIFTSSGNEIDAKPTENLCVSAYQLLKKDFPKLPAVQIHLHKNIPIGAGLGGGSADAAFTLQLLNSKFSLSLSQKDLSKYAATLGSDCAFFLLNKPCYATGRGELVQAVDLNLTSYKILLINPGIHINTVWAFSQLNLSTKKQPELNQLIKQPIQNWKNQLTNDFEAPVFAAYPEIEFIKNNLYQQGAIYAAMSGSGSSVYGIFEKEKPVLTNFSAHYFYKWV
jgi:4-diphosphocytidyl-2-C-methyl-D-erythritol kinase